MLAQRDERSLVESIFVGCPNADRAGIPIKALSIRHPWIDAILGGFKSLDIRSRPTAYRGRLLLHASTQFGHVEREALTALRSRIPGYPHGLPLPDPQRQARGALVGIATLAGCSVFSQSDETRALRAWTTRRFAWELTSIRCLPDPIPCKGRLGIFTVNDRCDINQLRNSLADVIDSFGSTASGS